MPEQTEAIASRVKEMTIQKFSESGEPIETLTLKPDEKLIIREYPDGRIEKEEITWL
jgi:hypothetical protein